MTMDEIIAELDKAIESATHTWMRQHGQAARATWGKVRENLIESKLNLMRAKHLGEAWIE